MIDVVTPANRPLFRASLDEMHRFRYRIAVEQWGWKIPGIEPGYDRDDFDTEDTIYFLAFGDGDRLVGCARLNPSHKPHMLSEVFADLCDIQSAPRDPAIYEYSRYLIDHQAMPKDKQLRVRGQISASINKFCLQVGITDLTWFAYQQMYPRAIKVWETKPLGTPKYFVDDDATYIAAISRMTEDGLDRLRENFRLDELAPRLLAPEVWDQFSPSHLAPRG